LADEAPKPRVLIDFEGKIVRLEIPDAKGDVPLMIELEGETLRALHHGLSLLVKPKPLAPRPLLDQVAEVVPRGEENRPQRNFMEALSSFDSSESTEEEA
jgi:hypothetical protein